MTIYEADFKHCYRFTFGPISESICFSLGDFSPIFCNYVGRFRV